MNTFRVEVDGVIVWSGDADHTDVFTAIPREFTDRPPHVEGEPYPLARHLFLGDELIGVQICQAEEDEGMPPMPDFVYNAEAADAGEVG
jgi:hypothetical protein